jgi:glycosyltransferase involved in cell wall biosynthesis
MASAPEVTVVVPTHSRWDLLSTAALPSALEQEDVDVEVIVVDDGSDDGTDRHLARLVDQRLRVVRHEKPRGVAVARNAGISAARGAWVAFLDDDDIWAPKKLRMQIDTAREANADFVFSASAALDLDRRFLYSLHLADPDRLVMQILRQNVIWAGSSNVIARSNLLRELGGFDESLFQLADWDLWIRLTLAGRAAVCPQILVGCVLQPRSMLLTDRRDVFWEMDYLVRKHRAASARHGVNFDLALFSRWVADGHLRAGRRRRAAKTYLRGAWTHRDIAAVPRAVAALLGEPAFKVMKRLFLARTKPREARDIAEPPWLARWREAPPSLEA